MRPPSANSGSSACVRKYTPLKWTLTSPSNCASVVSADQGVIAVAGVVDEMVEGLAPPGFAQGRAQALGEGAESGDVAAVELEGERLAAQGGDFPDDGLRLVGAALVGDDDVAAAAARCSARHCGRGPGWRR